MFDKSIIGMGKGNPSLVKNMEKREMDHKDYQLRGTMPGSELWTNGLICAFEYVRGHGKSVKPRPHSKTHRQDKAGGDKTTKSLVRQHEVVEASLAKAKGNNLVHSTSLMDLGAELGAGPSDDIDTRSSQSDSVTALESHVGSGWVPIGWARIAELVQTVQIDDNWASLQIDVLDDEDGLTVAELAAPYWERLGGPIWWCHVAAGHPAIDAWLGKAQWLHPAVSIALRDESRLISERMKHLLYEVPVRVAGGLLFELLGQSAGDPFVDEDDIPVVLRSWQAQNFLVTALHVKGTAVRINVLGIAEVEELLFAGGSSTPRTVHEVIAHLATRLARWDDRLFRKSIFGAADEVELKFVNRRNHEDTNLFSIILNQEITKLSRQVIRVKWSLHAREEIVFELLQHLRGNTAKTMLEGIRKSTRDMIDEQEAVRGRLFTIQDVMQSTVRAWLQDKSLRVTHNLAVFGGCGLVLSIITGLFGINVDGIPGAQNTPYAFLVFSAILLVLALVLIALGLLYLGLKQPVSEEQVEVRKVELQQLVKLFQHEAETHAQVSKVSRHYLPPTAADKFLNDADYILIH